MDSQYKLNGVSETDFHDNHSEHQSERSSQTSPSQRSHQVGTLRCTKEGHEKNFIKYICTYPQCKEKRINCAHCFIEKHIDHNDKKLTIDEFDVEFKKKYKELAKVVIELGLAQGGGGDVSRNEIDGIIGRFEYLKEEICNRIDDIRSRVIEDFQKIVFTNDVENVRTLAKKLVDNNSILQVTEFKTVSEDELTKFVEMYNDNFREEEDIIGQLSFIQTNVKVCYARLIQNIDDFRDNIYKELEKHMVPVLQIYVEDNFAAGRYKIYHKGCEDFPFLQFVPIFPCCDKAYPCAKCHDKAEGHKAKPARMVYCIRCKFMIENKYSNLKCIRCTPFADKMNYQVF